MRRILGTTMAALGVAALGLSAAPTVAATLPSTDTVYLLPCDAEEYEGILYSVDTTTGQATRVGDWENPDHDIFGCAGPGAYNPVDGYGYWISWADGSHLIQVDLATGENTHVGEFTIGGEPYWAPIALAIDGEGNAWASSYNLPTDTLFSLDLATAELTEVGPTGVTPHSQNYGLSWDPITDAVYAYGVSNSDLYLVDTVTGAFTLLQEDVFTALAPYAMHFDSAGQLWGVDGDIISAPLDDLAAFEVLEVINPYGDSEGAIYSESIIIGPAPAPVLPATGADRSAAVLIAVAGMVLIIGGALVVGRRGARAA